MSERSIRRRRLVTPLVTAFAALATWMLASHRIAEAAPPPTPSSHHPARDLSASEYHPSRNPRGLQAPNRAHGLRTWFETTGIRVHDRGAMGGDSLVDLSLAGLGRAAALRPVGPGVVRHAGARVEIERPGVTEWYENSARGLEQGFTLAQAPSGAGPLLLDLAVRGATATLQEDSVILESAAGRRLGYGGLIAIDARGRSLPSRLEVPDPQSLRLVVEDAGASYPIVIDPLLTAIPDATLQSNHVWSGTFDSAMFGHSLASAGDVNGDGFDDIVVGAFGWDVAGGLFDEGAAFVFLGGPDGIVGTDPMTANAVLLGDDAAGEFGWSVAGAGDVNGDGFDDIIVGAKRYDSPSGGGAAFVFLGSPTGIIGTGPPTAHASIFGSQSGGHLGTSVSGAGDVNNDGFGDIIVGSPPPGRSALNGSALVFLGSAAGITGSGVDDADRVILPHPPNQPVSGPDLLGYDVDAAGDVNNDGFDDVLVASGSYMLVFHGSAAGIVGTHPGNADAKIESDATISLYTVLSGAGDVNGDGFDDILVTGFATGQSVSFPGGFMVFHGSASGITATTPADADAFIASDDPLVIQGPVFYLGKNLAGAGDVDGDGFDDVLAAGLEFPGSFAREGIVHVFRGSPTGLEGASLADAYDPLTTGQEGGAQRNVWGLGIAGADVNGDGFADVLMGAGLYDAGQTDEGVVFVYHGEFNPGGSPNQVPVAYAGTDQSVQDADKNYSEEVTLDASGSFDPDGSIVSYEWYKGGTLLGSTEVLTTALCACGTQSIVLIVTDDAGSTASDTLTVRVEYPTDSFVLIDRFDSGLGNWVVVGDATLLEDTTTSSLYSTPHAQLGASGASMRRSIAMPAGSTGMRLQFWAKASQFGVSDELLVNVSVDGGPFTTFDTLRPQDEGLNDVGYAFYGGNVSHGPVSTTWVPATTSNIVLEFESNMSTGVFVIDSIEVRALIGNPSPVADAGPDQSADDAGGDGVESFTLDGSASFDSNGSIVSYEWRDGPTLLGNAASIGATLSLGAHTVVLTVTDDGGETASDSAVITVGAVGCATHADCDDGAFCNGTEICDPVLDCQPGTPVAVDDGIGCTSDSCDEVGDAIVNAVNNASCDNGQFCDGSETCSATLDCQAGTSVAIDDSVTCTLDACDETLNAVTHVADVGICDDGDPCTAEVCDPLSDCANVAIPNCGVSVPSAGPAGLLLGALSLVAAARRRLRSPR